MLISQKLSNIVLNTNRMQVEGLRSGILLMDITYLFIYELKLSLIEMKDCEMFVNLCDLKRDENNCFILATGNFVYIIIIIIVYIKKLSRNVILLWIISYYA